MVTGIDLEQTAIRVPIAWRPEADKKVGGGARVFLKVNLGMPGRSSRRSQTNKDFKSCVTSFELVLQPRHENFCACSTSNPRDANRSQRLFHRHRSVGARFHGPISRKPCWRTLGGKSITANLKSGSWCRTINHIPNPHIFKNNVMSLKIRTENKKVSIGMDRSEVGGCSTTEIVLFRSCVRTRGLVA